MVLDEFGAPLVVKSYADIPWCCTELVFVVYIDFACFNQIV